MRFSFHMATATPPMSGAQGEAWAGIGHYTFPEPHVPLRLLPRRILDEAVWLLQGRQVGTVSASYPYEDITYHIFSTPLCPHYCQSRRTQRLAYAE